VYIYRVILALVVVVAKDSPSLNVHIMSDDAVAHKVEMSDGTSFKQHGSERRFHISFSQQPKALLPEKEILLDGLRIIQSY